MNLTYKFTESADKGLTVTVLYDMRPYTYTQENHLDFYGLIGSLRDYSKVYSSGTDLSGATADVLDFLRPEFFRTITEDHPELTLKDDNIYYGDAPVNGLIVEHILKFKKQNLPFEPYWNFLEKLMSNPDERSRAQLYDFIEKNDFPPITMDGDILAYKGLQPNYTSVHKGAGVVNGVEYAYDYLPNNIGSVVSMPRHKVDSDPNSACSYGLHVGSLSYVNGFVSGEGKKVIVKVNPRDVVSVPRDCESRKIRCCLYTVVGDFDSEITETLVQDKYADDLETKLKAMVVEGVDNEFHLANRAIKRLHPEANGEDRKKHFDAILVVAKKVYGEVTDAVPVNEADPDLDALIKFVNDNSGSVLPATNLDDFRHGVYDIATRNRLPVREIATLVETANVSKIYQLLKRHPIEELTAEEWSRNFSR